MLQRNQLSLVFKTKNLHIYLNSFTDQENIVADVTWFYHIFYFGKSLFVRAKTTLESKMKQP